jgi:glyoxylase-like metal-dependent hydrolase (beta-lactamase superfamily II)
MRSLTSALRTSQLLEEPAMVAAQFDPDAISQFLGFDVSRRTLLRRLAGGGLAATVAAGTLRAGPAAAQQATQAAATGPLPAHHFRLGQLDLLVLDAGTFPLSAGFIAVNAPPQALAAAITEANLPPGDFPFPVHPLLVETGGQRVLIDTGIGPDNPTPGTLPAALAAEGIAAEEIDVVLFTHLHFDHATGAIDAAGKPAFPNARYLVGGTEYEFWWGEPSLAELPLPDEVRQLLRETSKAPLLALEGKIEQVAPGDEVASGVRVVDAAGHTPGHLAVEVTSDGEALLHVGDAASQPVLHLDHPDWFAGSDNWPAQSLMSRRMLLDRAATEDMLVMTYHFPFPGVGSVAIDGDGWLWEPAA